MADLKFVSKVNTPDGTSYDIKDAHKSGVYPVIGTQTAATNVWTGALHGVNALYDGLTIMYYLPWAGTSTAATLNLTLDNGTSTGAVNCYYSTSRLTTHYGKGCNIIMTYHSAGSIKVDGTATTDNRWIANANYDSNSDTKARQTLLTNDTNRPLLMSYALNDNTTTNVDNVAYRNNSIYANPSTGTITATTFAGDASTVSGGHTVAKDVPSNAVFTDTTYTFANGGTNKFTVTPSGGTAQDVTFTASDSTKVAKTGDSMSGDLKFSATGKGVYLKDSASVEYAGIYDNGSNLWIGATSSTGAHHKGGTYISAGLSSDGTTGNSSIYVSKVTKSGSTYSSTQYLVAHAGNVGTGDSNGQVKIAGTNVSVKGLAAAAYKAVDTTVTSGSANLVTSGAVYNAIDALPEPMIFKGSVGTGGTITTLPAAAAANEGFTYKVITAMTTPVTAKVGDTVISNGSEWVVIPSGDEPSGTVTSITLKATSPIAIDSTSAITTSGTRTLSHANSGVTAGTYRSVTVNATGHVTAGTNPTTLSGYGITDAKITSGTITLGSNTITPLTASSNLKEAYLEWGGKNFTGSYGCIDAAMVSELGANRLAFPAVEGITIEYSRDGGSTWTDYGATNGQKLDLFSRGGTAFIIGKADTSHLPTNDGKFQLRVTLATGTAKIYTALNKFVFYVSTSSSSNCYVKIQKALQSTPTTIIDHTDWIEVSGWSGYNVINCDPITTYGNQASSQYGRLIFLFKGNGGSATYLGLHITKIMGFGGVGWITPSNMAKTGHLYSFDPNQNATFPAQVTATKFIGPLQGNADSASSVPWSGVTDKPTIPSAANNGKLSIKLASTEKVSFTANQSGNSTANFVFTPGTTPSTITKKTVVTGATFNTVVTGGTTTDIPNISKKTVVTGVTKKTVVTDATFNTVVTSATITGEKLIISTGVSGSKTTGDSCTVSTGDSVTVGTAIKAYTSLSTGVSGSATTGDSVTVTAGTAPSLSITSS